MNKKIAITVAVLSVAAAVPLATYAGSERHGGNRDCSPHRMGMGGHEGMRGGMHGDMRGDLGQHGMHGGMHGQIRMLELIERYDADGSGSLTQVEIDAGRAARLGEFDADGNGTLSLAEYEALWLDAMRESMVRRFQRHDRDGDGQVTAEEFGRRMEHMVMMRDRNGDGVLDLEDAGGPGEDDGQAQ